MKSKKVFIAGLSVLTSVAMVACNGGGGGDKPTTKYKVSVIEKDGATIKIDNLEYAKGITVKFSVTCSKQHYNLEIVDESSTKVTYKEESKDNYTFVMPEKNVSITASGYDDPEPTKYKVSKTEKDGAAITISKTEYEKGETVSFSVTCSKQHYNLEVVDESSTKVTYKETSKDNYTFVMPEKNVTISASGYDEEEPLTKKLTFEERYQDIWNSQGKVYNEQVMLHEHEDGSVYGELLYEPTSITLVKDYLMTNLFTKDTDFTVEGKKIIIKNKDTTKMPYLTKDQYDAKPTSLEGTGIGTLESSKSPSGYVLYSEYPHIVKKTILVSYEHNDTRKGHEMYKLGNRLPNTLTKLKSKGSKFNLAIYGDSNATGAVTSGYWKEDYEGTHPGAADLFHDKYDLQDSFHKGFKTALETVYGVDCDLYNPSEGGKTSGWMNQKPESGAKNLWTGKPYDTSKTHLANWLDDSTPDLVVFVWGNNDSTFGVDADTFMNNIDTAIQEILKKNPNCEFIISLPKRSNPLATQDVTTLGQAYLNIVKAYIKNHTTGFAFHDMTTLTSDLLTYKDAYSLFGNGINHSNDFLARQWVSLFMNTLKEPEEGKEWDYDNDPTIVDPKIDYAKDWVKVVSDKETKETPVNLSNGVELPSLTTFSEGYARKEKVYLDGLEFDLRGENMSYDESKGLSTCVGFFFTKAVGTWESGSYPFNTFAFNIIDIYNQNRVFVGTSHDYNKSTIMYTDKECKTLFTGNETNQMIFNRLSNSGETDYAGVRVSFNKLDNNTYSIKIKSLYANYMWENNPNYDASDMSCTYYLKADVFSSLLNEDGSIYLNVYGFGSQTGWYTGDNLARITNLTQVLPAPQPIGETTKTYKLNSRESIKFYYDPVIESSEPMGLERSKTKESFESIDIAHRSFGTDQTGKYVEINNVGLEYIAKQSGTGTYFIRLQCTNGYCSFTLNIIE